MFSKIIKLLKIINFYKNSKSFKIVHIFGISKINIFLFFYQNYTKKNYSKIFLIWGR